jgi:hypothetical protein
MQILQTKWFAHWAGKEELSSQVLCAAVTEISQGLVDAISIAAQELYEVREDDDET